MANKRTRRDRTTSAPGTSATATTEASNVRPAPPEPGGPNRQARKEEARRQREAIRRRATRRRILQRVAIVLAVVLVAGAIGAYFVLRTTPADAAGCGSVRTISAYDPSSEDRTHIGDASQVTTPPPLSTYPSAPPASGPHEPNPLPSGTYDTPPDVYRTIHSLEHAAVVIWYDPSATGSALDALKAFYQDPVQQDHVILAPYSYPDQGAAGTLPAGKDMVLVAWHRMQTCDRVSLDAAKSFVGGYRFDPQRPGAYRGDAPEAGAAI
jgi:hypothetical protein